MLTAMVMLRAPAMRVIEKRIPTMTCRSATITNRSLRRPSRTDKFQHQVQHASKFCLHHKPKWKLNREGEREAKKPGPTEVPFAGVHKHDDPLFKRKKFDNKNIQMTPSLKLQTPPAYVNMRRCLQASSQHRLHPGARHQAGRGRCSQGVLQERRLGPHTG